MFNNITFAFLTNMFNLSVILVQVVCHAFKSIVSYLWTVRKCTNGIPGG